MAEFILKDSRGKESTFNHDKIFVQNENGELVQFTEGTGEAVLENLEVTENGTYTPGVGVDGFGNVVVNVDSTKVTILPEQTISGFADADGIYGKTDESPTYTISVGKKYSVKWDGVVYGDYTAEYINPDEPIIFLGNKSMLGMESTGEPFLIVYADGAVNYIAYDDTSESHTVAIWQKVTGGASDDVRYVTFMSYDGLTEYGKKAVAVGDDCADPIVRGIFDTPTRESDVQYDYTFGGWATEANGEADSAWNEAITEDKTVYAAFNGAVRYYTITYYDEDGTTVLNTESLAYGTMPSYKPTKDGVVFDSWTPTLTVVTGDTSYTASWSEKLTFAGATWADIARVSESGQAADHFALGDSRDITFTNNGETYDVKFRIVGFNHDTTEDGKTAGITLMSYYALRKSTVGAESDGFDVSRGIGWSASTIREILNSTTIGFLPDDLVSHIKSVQKLSTISGNAFTLETTIDKLFIPSITELGKTSNQTAKDQGVAYAITPTVSTRDTQDKSEIVNATTDSSGTTIYIGTRSGNSYGSSFVTCLKASTGAVDYGGKAYVIACQVGFCI